MSVYADDELSIPNVVVKFTRVLSIGVELFELFVTLTMTSTGSPELLCMSVVSISTSKAKADILMARKMIEA
jgi:hypothetical protein